jgi:uncharacterized protein YjbI with pentapeptide repeats
VVLTVALARGRGLKLTDTRRSSVSETATVICHKTTGAVLYRSTAATIKEVLAEALKAKADLRGAHLYEADLGGAHLYEADLSGADLREADLYGADLGGADLRGAHLYEADLREADLREADLRGAHLGGANLRGAHLYGADLREAHLYGADLSGAHLYGADLSGAHLSGADLRGADLYGADLSGAHLSGAKIPWQSHDVIAAILFAAAGKDVGKRKAAGLILVSRDWCWRDFLAIDDPLKPWVLETLAAYVTDGDNAPQAVRECAAKHAEEKGTE